jgi:hypothetical protein
MNRGINYQLINSRDITIHDGDVVSSDSTDSEQDREKYVLAPSTTTLLRFSPLNYQKL